jgi:DNA-binding IclR family transcriptional regulator
LRARVAVLALRRTPLHGTSLGKAILAFLSEREQATQLRRLPLRGLAPNTLADRRRLTATLCIIRRRGFAVDYEEILPGVCCVGAATSPHPYPLRLSLKLKEYAASSPAPSVAPPRDLPSRR